MLAPLQRKQETPLLEVQLLAHEQKKRVLTRPLRRWYMRNILKMSWEDIHDTLSTSHIYIIARAYDSYRAIFEYARQDIHRSSASSVYQSEIP